MLDGRKRVVIENVTPQVDGGRFSIKRCPGEEVLVQADVFGDGHDVLSARVLYRRENETDFLETMMRPLVNDRWEGSFFIQEDIPHHYTVQAWVDHFLTWKQDLEKKFQAGQDVSLDLLDGANLIRKAAERADSTDKKTLTAILRTLENERDREEGYALVQDPVLHECMVKYPDLSLAVRFEKELRVTVDPPKALFSTWYELFPRSAGVSDPKKEHGTFKDVEDLLPEIASMGFDVLYMPPIHPIGRTNRKGKNNNPEAGRGAPGSPWAIGSPEGGHKSIHPGLGTMKDFQSLIGKAKEKGMDVALDIAFQCSPDHPYVKKHPEWFKKRADGSIQYAENPPKKYEDIYPLNFECEEWQELWEELKSVFLFWAEKGVRFFRVDNPHTKPFRFWEWVIREIKTAYPDAVFLSEAFTRPKVMYRLAKAGFTQSYTYFTWRNTKYELTHYMKELTTSAPRDFFRPNFWPNTPDILPEYLQYGGRQAFLIRTVLAATLSSNYGIYGPAFELAENAALPGREEYADSEKFEIKAWDRKRSGNLKAFIRRINAIRRENTALQSTWNLTFLEADNDFILFYAKVSPDGDNILLIAVNLDPYNMQSGWLTVPLEELGIDSGQSYLAHDLLGDDKFIWQGNRNFIQLDPYVLPARIFRIRRKLKRESDFDYFM